MNSKRRAELQRKLTLNAVPRPPAGLAERIKADIPKYLQPETVPQRITRSLAFPMRIAASLIVVAGAVIVAMMVTQGRPEKMASTAADRPIIFAPSSRAVPQVDETSTTSVARTEEVQLDIVQEAPPLVAPQITSARVAPPPLSPPTLEQQRAFEEEQASRDAETGAPGGVSFGVIGGVAGAAEDDRRAEPQQIAEYAPEMPVPAPVAPPSAPAPPTVQASEAMADATLLERRQDRAAAAKLSASAGARERKAEQESVFGISVRPEVFHSIRTTLESGQRPAASAVDVQALVNYFAGAPARRPRNAQLEVEVSPAAISAEGEHAVLRFTVDTPAGTGILAPDARIDVAINNDVVVDFERIGDAESLGRASALPYGTSVTGLYALEMKPGLRSSQVIATVRLTYTRNGKPETITKTVRASDFSRTWQRSSRRHRLASLGALWAQSLKGTASGGADVARRANELATQNPADERARDLARAANASAAGGF